MARTEGGLNVLPIPHAMARPASARSAAASSGSR